MVDTSFIERCTTSARQPEQRYWPSPVRRVLGFYRGKESTYMIHVSPQEEVHQVSLSGHNNSPVSIGYQPAFE